MARTQATGRQLLDGSVQRSDLDVSTAGSAVIRRALAGTGIALASTGPDPGTGDVTFSANYAGNTGRTVTASVTLAAGEGVLVTNASAANAVTIPPNSSVAFAQWTIVSVIQKGAGKTTFAAGSGVTLVGATGIRAQGGGVSLIQTAINTWQIVGDTDDALPNVFYKGTSGTNGITVFQTVAANGFNKVTITDTVSALGGIALDGTTNKINIPVTGTYDIRATVRLSDNQTARSIGIGVAVTAADSPNFYWAKNVSELGASSRWTGQYTNINPFTAGDAVQLFIYSDGNESAPLIAASLILKLIG